tara:strand:+ start:441 stop:2501 length:2061 start_codon:yes stop_codon:yes gene_type:complete
LNVLKKVSGFLGSFKNSRSGTKANPLTSPTFGGSLSSFGGIDAESAYSGQAPWVSVAVDKIVRDVSSQGWFFTDKEGNKVDDNRVPDEIKVPFELGWGGLKFNRVVEFTVHNRLLSGNAFIWKTEGTRFGQFKGFKDSLIPLAASDVKVVLTSNGLGISHYEVTLSGGDRFDVSTEDMIHSAQISIISPFIGVGTIAKGRLLFEGAVAAAEYVNTFLAESKNMPLSTVIENGSRDTDDMKRFSEMLKDKYSKKMAYLNGEGISITNSSLIQKDFKFIEMQQDSRQTTLSLFGVPPEVAGITENSNRATGNTQQNTYYKGTVNPLLISLAEDFTNQHIRQFDSELNFNFSLHPTGDTDNIIKKLQNGMITPNRAAEESGEEFDLTDEDRNTYYFPGNLFPLGTEPVGSVGGGNAGDIEEDEASKEEGKALPRLDDPKNIEAILDHFEKGLPSPKKFQRKYLGASLKSRVQVEEKFVGKLSKFFKKQEARVLENLKELNPKSLKVEVSELDNSLIFNLEEETKAFSDEIKPLHTSAVQKSVSDINSITGYGVNLNTSNPYIAGAIANLGKDVSGQIQKSTLKELQRLIAKGVNESWNINEFQDAIQGKFEQFQGYRARMIARTESRAAWDAGSKVAYQEIGVRTVDVVGCQNLEEDSDCGKLNIPIEQMSTLRFHPNHIGSVLPSKEV